MWFYLCTLCFLESCSSPGWRCCYAQLHVIIMQVLQSLHLCVWHFTHTHTHTHTHISRSMICLAPGQSRINILSQHTHTQHLTPANPFTLFLANTHTHTHTHTQANPQQNGTTALTCWAHQKGHLHFESESTTGIVRRLWHYNKQQFHAQTNADWILGARNKRTKRILSDQKEQSLWLCLSLRLQIYDSFL